MDLPQIIKVVTDAGLGIASLACLVAVIFFQRKDMKEFYREMKAQSEGHVAALKELSENVKSNTHSTEKVVDVLDLHRQMFASKIGKKRDY